MKKIALSYEEGRYFLNIYSTGSRADKMIYEFGEKSLKRLVEAYKSEGIEVVNGNLDEKIFSYLTDKK